MQGRSGVDLPAIPQHKDRLGGLKRKSAIGLPGLSEPQVMRHYTRLSQKNYAIDTGVYPLGSCTMKHNPRLNEKMARLPGFGDLHPMQPVSTVQGALELIDTLAHWLKTLTGMPAVAMSPAAGAHGELCGIMTIRAALLAKGERASASWCRNPRTAPTRRPRPPAATRSIRSRPTIAAASISPPSRPSSAPMSPAPCSPTPTPAACSRTTSSRSPTRSTPRAATSTATAPTSTPSSAACGRAISASTPCTSTCTRPSRRPHGGGGPGSGPVVLSEALAPYAPVPYVVHGANGFELVESRGDGKAFGRLKGFHGQMGMFVRALGLHAEPRLRRLAPGRGRRGARTPTTSWPASRT